MYSLLTSEPTGFSIAQASPSYFSHQILITYCTYTLCTRMSARCLRLEPCCCVIPAITSRRRTPLDCAVVYVGRFHSFTANVDFIVDTVRIHSQRSECAKRHLHADHITSNSKALDPWLARVVCYTFAKHMLHTDCGTFVGTAHEGVGLPMLCNIQHRYRSRSTAPFSSTSLSRQLVFLKNCCMANHGYRHGYGMAAWVAGLGYRAAFPPAWRGRTGLALCGPARAMGAGCPAARGLV